MTHYAILLDNGDIRLEMPHARAFCLKTFGAGACLDVELREHRAKRSDKQNRAMWALLNAWVQEARRLKIDHAEGWYPDDLKDAVMGRVFGTIERRHPLTNEIILRPGKERTSGLSVGEFAQVIECILEAAAAEHGVFLEAPDEYRIAKEKARKQAAKAA